MLIASSTTAALLIALILGTAGSAWLWLVHNRKLVTNLGLRALAAMRWRESSRFIIEALESQGFTASRLSPDASRGQNADLLLNRGDQTWLLGFKQGVDYRVDAKMVTRMAAAVRDSNSSGGIIATLGTMRGEARRHPHGIELIDGATLWPLISPLLPPSLHNEVVARARRRTTRATGVVWLMALLAGLAASLLIPQSVVDPAGETESTRIDTPAAVDTSPKNAERAQPMAPAKAVGEEAQRSEVVTLVGALPGVERTGWVTRSTLVAVLQAGASEAQIDGICKVLARYEELRYSRVQLQPPPGSVTPVRFLQCN